MRKSWRKFVWVLLLGLCPQWGCVQTPGDKSVRDLQPMQHKAGSAKQQELTGVDMVHSWSTQVDMLEREHKLNEAIVLCEQMRQPGSPQQWQATRKLAFLYDQNQDVHKAMDEYKRLLQQNPKDADVIAKIGDMFSRQGKWPAAEKWYRDALQQRPDHASARSGLALALAQTCDGDYTPSLNEYEKVLGSRAEAYCAVAFVMKLQGKRQDALQAYQQALRIDPNLERARTGLRHMQNAHATEPPPNLDAAMTGRKGVVLLEDAPVQPTHESSRLLMQRPSLPPLPDIK